MRIYELQNNIFEGKYDPHIFKAIFLAGGPGSGKSFVTRQLQGGTGLRVVNSDDFFTMIARRTGEDLSSLPNTPKGDRLHKTAKKLSSRKLDRLLDGRIGVIIDGTGRNYSRIRYTKARLDTKGYDTMMILVNTDLETAKRRNERRERKIQNAYLERSHKEIRNNIGKFQDLFGSNFIVVDNSEDSDTDFNNLWKKVGKWLNSPVKNEYAQQWLTSEKEQ